jgi:hypothetical protein
VGQTYVLVTEQRRNPIFDSFITSRRRIRALQTYSARQPTQGYPRALVDLGPQGLSFVDELIVSGKTSTYNVTYTPGPPDASGRITTYTISVRPISYGIGGAASYFCNESGVIHWTDEDRPATTEDPSQTP